jgi:hypothetical protein
MGIMVPETCWASNKICNKNSSVASSWHFISTYFTLTLFSPLSLLHVSMRKYHNERVSIHAQFTKNIKAKSTAVHRCHNEVKGLKSRVILYSKLVTIFQVYLNYNRCILLAIRYHQYLYLRCPLTNFTTSVSLSPCSTIRSYSIIHFTESLWSIYRIWVLRGHKSRLVIVYKTAI